MDNFATLVKLIMSKRAKGKKNKDFDSDPDEDVQSVESKGKGNKGNRNDPEEKVNSKKKKGGKKTAAAAR